MLKNMDEQDYTVTSTIRPSSARETTSSLHPSSRRSRSELANPPTTSPDTKHSESPSSRPKLSKSTFRTSNEQSPTCRIQRNVGHLALRYRCRDGIPGAREDACFLKEPPDAEKLRERVMDYTESTVFPDEAKRMSIA